MRKYYFVISDILLGNLFYINAAIEYVWKSKMRKLENEKYFSVIGWKNYLKSVKRRRKEKNRRASYNKSILEEKRIAKTRGETYKPHKNPFTHTKPLPPKPDWPINFEFLSNVPDLFTKNQYNKRDDGHFFLPETFSLIDNYDESFNFLKRLFQGLRKSKCEKIELDYSKCSRIDVDASVCMDIILMDFIKYQRECFKRGHRNIWPLTILPVNFSAPHIMKILFSIGAYKNIRGLSIKYDDVEPLPLLINNQKDKQVWEVSEVHQTDIVDYIKRCLQRLGRELTQPTETELYKVIGEIMNNAEEHSTMPYRYAIGFFQETHNPEEHFGIFNLSIFNFGKTIYQKFKDPECPNHMVVEQMSRLSEDYTKRGLFYKAEFEEETLWTLYALQEGVTSAKKKRGNGSIQFIENFFNLKGDGNKDNISKLVIVSGNTRIAFDGEYTIKEKEKVAGGRKYKMMTFNTSGEISDAPDKKFVSFAPNFFPGTLISARILIKFDNTNEQNNGSQNP